MTNLDTKRTIAILFSGRAGVGKSTSANMLIDYLTERYPGVTMALAPFATGVKLVATKMGWNGVKDSRGRKLLTEIGRVGRTYHENCWVDFIMERLENHPNYPLNFVLIDDWRFPNEAAVLENNPLYSLVRIRIESIDRESLKGTPEYEDISENSLPPGGTLGTYDYTIYNYGSLQDLEESVKALWEYILQFKENQFKWT